MWVYPVNIKMEETVVIYIEFLAKGNWKVDPGRVIKTPIKVDTGATRYVGIQKYSGMDEAKHNEDFLNQFLPENIAFKVLALRKTVHLF